MGSGYPDPSPAVQDDLIELRRNAGDIVRRRLRHLVDDGEGDVDEVVARTGGCPVTISYITAPSA